MATDQWRPLFGWEDCYEINALGTVRSIERRVHRSKGYTRRVRERVMRQWISVHGYPQVTLARDGRTTHKPIHRAVIESFQGACPAGLEVCHNDGNRLNPRLENLRFDTRSNNLRDMHDHGTCLSGAANAMAKLSDDQVLAIRADTRAQRIIAIEFGIAQGSVSKIKRRVRWAHL